MTATGLRSLGLLPWMIASLAVHALVLLQWPQARSAAPSIAELSASAPLHMQLLHRAKPVQAPAPRPANALATTDPEMKTAVAKRRPAASVRPFTASARRLAHNAPSQGAPAQHPPATVTAPPAVSATRTLSGAAAATAVSTRGDGRAEAAAGEWKELVALLHAAIDRHKRYPQSALVLGREGAARIDFSLSPDGRIDDLNIGVSSGIHALDVAAYRAVQAIAPFAGAERYLDRAQRFQVDVVFRIN